MVFFAEAKGAIYKSERSFNSSDELLYSQWIQKSLTSDIFSNPESPYYGIKTDCADAAFALRAIYAFENKLSFEFIDNEGRKITENLTNFDSGSDVERLKKLIEYISENAGSEMLAGHNTYPIELKSIRPGDLYITKWKNSSGGESRHVYIIKDILPTGDLLLFSSTQPRAIRPLLARKGMPLHFFSEMPFGFRRFYSSNERKIMNLENYSLEQYELMLTGEKKFFSEVKLKLKNDEDTLQNNFDRRIENVCVALTARKDVVDLALKEKMKLGKKCFDEKRYDEFSTPSRDQNIIKDIERLRNGYRFALENSRQNELSEETHLGMSYLIGINKSKESLESLKQMCSLEIQLNESQQVIVNIKSFYDRSQAKLISSNPNESRLARWGYEKESKACKRK